MEIETSVWVTLPQNRVQGILYLLHDNGKNHTYFNRNISLESLCDKYQVAAVVPDMDVSCCLDLWLNYNLRFWFAKLNSWEPILDKYKCYQLRF